MNSVMMTLLVTAFVLFVLFPTRGQSAPMSWKIGADAESPQNMVDAKTLFCSNKIFGAAFKGPDDKQYYFNVYQVFVVGRGVVQVFPRKTLFPNSPYFVNSMSFSQRTGKAYLFKDGKVWIYKYHKREFQFLQTKSLGRTSPNIVEAAFYHQGFIYLLKDGFLYGWDEQSNSVIPSHIFPIDYFWKDVPSKATAAMEYKDGRETVFWKRQGKTNMQYYSFDNRTGKLAKKGSFTSFFGICKGQ